MNIPKKLKDMLGEKMLNLPYKTAAIMCGILAQMLIVKGAISIEKYPLEATIGILYAFFILLPIA